MQFDLSKEEERKELLNYTLSARKMDHEYFERERGHLVAKGYDGQAIDDVLVHEKRKKEALREMFYPTALMFLGAMKPEDAQKEIQPHLDEYNHSLEIQDQILGKRMEQSQLPAEGQEPRMG